MSGAYTRKTRSAVRMNSVGAAGYMAQRKHCPQAGKLRDIA
jgi:hypothetical protein